MPRCLCKAVTYILASEGAAPFGVTLSVGALGHPPMYDFVGELGAPPVRRSDQGINPLARRDEAPAGLPRANASAGIGQPRRGFVPPSRIAPTPTGRPCPVPSPEPRRLEFANKVIHGRVAQRTNGQGHTKPGGVVLVPSVIDGGVLSPYTSASK